MFGVAVALLKEIFVDVIAARVIGFLNRHKKHKKKEKH